MTAASDRPPRLLHVLNGDVVREKLERAGVPGTLAVWADALPEGPVPGPAATPGEWREVRARFVERVGYATRREALDLMRRWDEGLESFPEHDEVVIWVEHDLFDQLLLVRHLDWFARRAGGPPRLSLIGVGSWPGIPDFRGLGQLAPDQLAPLLDTREPVTAAQLRLASAAWTAFTAPDPRGLERLLADDTSALPFLAPALRRHLEEFPSVRNGLSRTEETVLRLLAGGPLAVGDLFHAVHRRESAYFVTDASFRTVLRALAGEPDPAIELDGAGEGSGVLPGGSVRLTDTGRALLEGRAERRPAPGSERWLGGVRLAAEGPRWRWDPVAGRLAHG